MKVKKSISLDKRGRDFYIQQVTSFQYQNHQYVATARRAGSIQIYRITNDEIQLVFVYGNNLHLYGESEDHFISLRFRDNSLHSCSCLGKVVIQSLSPILNEHHVNDYQTLNYLSLTISAPVTCFKLHPLYRWVSISGGKDREVEINDFYALTHLWKSKHTSLIEDLYLDEDLDETKWVQDLVIIEADATRARNMKMILASKFEKLMLFDTTISMYPLAVLEIAVSKIFMLGDHSKIMTLDSFNNAHIIDVESFKIIQSFKHIETGPMASMEMIEDDTNGCILFIGGYGCIKSYRITPLEDKYEITALTRFNFSQKSIIPALTVF